MSDDGLTPMSGPQGNGNGNGTKSATAPSSSSRRSEESTEGRMWVMWQEGKILVSREKLRSKATRWSSGVCPLRSATFAK